MIRQRSPGEIPEVSEGGIVEKVGFKPRVDE